MKTKRIGTCEELVLAMLETANAELARLETENEELRGKLGELERMNVAKRPCNLERDGMPDMQQESHTGTCGECANWMPLDCELCGVCSIRAQELRLSGAELDYMSIHRCTSYMVDDCYTGHFEEKE